MKPTQEWATLMEFIITSLIITIIIPLHILLWVVSLGHLGIGDILGLFRRKKQGTD